MLRGFAHVQLFHRCWDNDPATPCPASPAANARYTALAMLGDLEPAVIVADQRMPGMSGIELLREAKTRYPDTYAVLLTAYADLEVLIDAVKVYATEGEIVSALEDVFGTYVERTII